MLAVCSDCCNMTKKEIVKQALLHKKTPEVPYYMKFAAPVYTKLRKHFGVEDVGEAVRNYITSFAPGYGRNFKPRELPGNSYYDEFGCLWQGTEANVGQIKEPVLKKASLSGYWFPDAGDANRLKGLRELIAKRSDTYLIVNLESHTLLERAFNLRGMAQLMMDMYDHPDFVEELLDRILEYDWELARHILEFDIDAIKINDDWGDQRGVLIGVERWRALIKPRIAELCKRIKKEKEVDIFLHSDGNIADIIPDIIEMGITAINPMQPEVMDIFELKKRFGKEVTFFGGMNTQSTMPFGTPDEVASEMRRLVRELGRDGGFILSPGIIMQEDVPMENILTFIRICQEQAF